MSLRRVRPQIQDYSDAESDEHMFDAPFEDEDNDVNVDGAGEGSEDNSEDSSESSIHSSDYESSDEEEPKESATSKLEKVSFGTLSRAAASLRSTTKPTANPSSARAAAVKAQLGALRSTNPKPSTSNSTTTTAKTPKPRKTREELKRSSKHAPQEISSKRAVTRYRTIMSPPPAASRPRDPRFDSAVRGVYDERVFKHNYEFLEGYRKDEVGVLKNEMKKEKDEKRKEELGRAVRSMESRQQQQQQKERSDTLMREQKKKERELVKQGKKPFYLKKTEQKKLLLLDKYRSLNEKQLDKTIEKKRKRKAQKEHRNVPYARREA